MNNLMLVRLFLLLLLFCDAEVVKDTSTSVIQ